MASYKIFCRSQLFNVILKAFNFYGQVSYSPRLVSSSPSVRIYKIVWSFDSIYCGLLIASTVFLMNCFSSYL